MPTTNYYLIASDFLWEWELITAPNMETVDTYILSNGGIADGIQVINSSQDAFYDDLDNYNYTIVYLSDYDFDD